MIVFEPIECSTVSSRRQRRYFCSCLIHGHRDYLSLCICYFPRLLRAPINAHEFISHQKHGQPNKIVSAETSASRSGWLAERNLVQRFITSGNSFWLIVFVVVSHGLVMAFSLPIRPLVWEEPLPVLFWYVSCSSFVWHVFWLFSRHSCCVCSTSFCDLQAQTSHFFLALICWAGLITGIV